MPIPVIPAGCVRNVRVCRCCTRHGYRVLARCRFLALVDRFYRYTGRFGHSPEGNPSTGNLFRGLYNIALKVRPPSPCVFRHAVLMCVYLFAHIALRIRVRIDRAAD